MTTQQISVVIIMTAPTPTIPAPTERKTEASPNWSELGRLSHGVEDAMLVAVWCEKKILCNRSYNFCLKNNIDCLCSLSGSVI